MGKFATYSKRGGGPRGFLSAPDVALFSLGAITATTVEVNYSGTVPPQAAQWRVRAISLTGALSAAAVGTTTATLTGLVSATTYNLYVEWLGTGIYANMPVSPLVFFAQVTTA